MLMRFLSASWTGRLFAALPAVALLFGLSSQTAFSQPAAKSKKPAEAKAKTKDSEEEEEVDLTPQDLVLKTEDGLDLHTVYYPGPKLKKSVPVILLHAFKGDHRDFDELAQLLQSIGCAVIVPDLRGHGDSKSIARTSTTSDEVKKQTLDAKTLRPGDFADMVRFDVETVKQYLRQRNNEGKLNIDRLCLVGAEMGAAVALNYAALDWNVPDLLTGKQGKDVKALVLISPDRNFKGLATMQALDDPNVQTQISVMIVAGNKGSSKAVESAKQIHKKFERFHPPPAEGEAKEKKDLFLISPATSLQGTPLLTEKSLDLPQKIAQFINLRLMASKKSATWPWALRKDPLE